MAIPRYLSIGRHEPALDALAAVRMRGVVVCAPDVMIIHSHCVVM